MDDTEQRAAARVGNVLSGKWKLERLLGIGGMAAVYAGRHRNGARAAVKILHPDLARVSAIRDRFLREGYAANRVEHPGAVSVLDDDVVVGGPDDGSAYIVMEILEGEALEDRAAKKPLTEQELLTIADSVLDVLDAAHAHGVVHRDLKPDNLFLLSGDELRVKVLDFGLARIVEERAGTRAGVALGTPAYMSPEQAGGRADEIDGRTDLFSVGAVMFRLRTGKRIHEAASTVELVGKMARLPAPKIRDVDPTVSPAFAAIVDRALAFDRHDRYPDAKTMRADVRAALLAMAPATSGAPQGASATLVANPAAFDATTPGLIEDVAPEAKGGPTPPPPPRRRAQESHDDSAYDDSAHGVPGRSIGLLPVLFLLLLIGGGVFVWRGGLKSVALLGPEDAPAVADAAPGELAAESASAAPSSSTSAAPSESTSASAEAAPAPSTSASAEAEEEEEEEDDDAGPDGGDDAAVDAAEDADLDAAADATPFEAAVPPPSSAAVAPITSAAKAAPAAPKPSAKPTSTAKKPTVAAPAPGKKKKKKKKKK